MTEGLEYSLVLDTGEALDVLELDQESCAELRSEDVRAAVAGVLLHCTYVARDVLEEAKNGFCKRFQDVLKTPPVGCLLKVGDPACAELGECGIADPAICTTRHVSRSGGRFPVCWEARPSRPCGSDTRRAARDLAGRIVHAWREGRYVVIVRSS